LEGGLGEQNPRRASVAPQVRTAHLGDGAVVLCLATGQYFGLGLVATTIWDAIAGGATPGETCARISSTFGVPVMQAAADYANFVDDLTQRGWLVEGLTSVSAPAPGRRVPRNRRFLRTRALSSLLAVSARLAARGFPAAYRYARSWALLEPGAAASPVATSACVDAFRSAESLFVSRRGPDDCLSRSLSLFVFLRRARLPAMHQIGVAESPFAAHAWVECDGEALLEEPERLRRFTVIASIP
jgi:transglutaminase superfamily protein/coenzyme PQQ synthesis protein D (PqqD)